MASYKLKETRLNLEPQSSSSVLVIALPGPDGAARNLTKRSDSAASHEAAYKAKNLASASSIYHRRHRPHHGGSSAPRSFLWRLVEDNTALSVRPVDVCQSGGNGTNGNGGETDALLHPASSNAAGWPLTLELHFVHALVPACVALADSPDRDALDIFALDERGYLCSVSLRADFFRRRDALELSAKDWYRYHLSSGFSFRHPHRLVADENASSLVVTLHDGGMIRFDRNKHFHCKEYTVLMMEKIPSGCEELQADELL